MSVNKAILIGRLGKDPELRYTSGGKAVATFTLATSDTWTGDDGQKKESTVWHNIVAWGKQAEVLKEYMAKGRMLYIEGRIQNRSYDDKDGNKRYVSEVVVNNFQFLGDRGGDRGGKSAETPMESGPTGAPPPDDDLPF